MSMFDRIKDLASKRDKNLKDVAIEIGLSENIFYTWKNSSPKADVIKKVADYFNVSTDYLLGRTDNPIIDSDIPPEAATLAAHIDPAATEEDMKKILEYIDFIQQKYK
ncbi:helix-turn-helix transcriptional regulator [Listeria monocytogenes]|uniref:helix-turn-helix domain-containing protein n=1 Tax=Listeria monocytogenes TaxID=1639 RepID=UPI0010E6A9CB|nr:helix-turn-helix transcriptional regulator [Listeria monocytogenes]EAE4067358.1 XRE family transcriptional regulator [Listeria monocytogenes]EAE9479337.1 XRE family transcriptional regulator [Listeria monocytogenes]EAG2526690.1 XRE family transcriptional regulator [Listeria monocytogenes]MCI2543991.1 helix-turn-helix transcriptional regulator [Listeria monocytogenes]